MRLRTRMGLTYGLCFCMAFLGLRLASNQFAAWLFSNFVQQNFQAQSQFIVESVQRQYDAKTGRFNTSALMILGMDYAHQGYILSIHDPQGELVWDARAWDMELCNSTMQEIQQRMSDHRLDSHTARKIADGDFSARMACTYAALELQELSQSVNDLAAALPPGFALYF